MFTIKIHKLNFLFYLRLQPGQTPNVITSERANIVYYERIINEFISAARSNQEIAKVAIQIAHTYKIFIANPIFEGVTCYC